MIPFLAGRAIPWRAIGIGVGLLVLFVSLWWVQSRIRVSYQAEAERDTAIATHTAYKAQVERDAAEAAKQRERDELADANTAARIESLEAERERLRRQLASIKATQEKLDANGIPRTVINPGWWLCVSTHVTRDPADLAACETDRGDAGLPGAVSH